MGTTRRRTMTVLSGLSVLVAVAACGSNDTTTTTTGADATTDSQAGTDTGDAAATADAGDSSSYADGTYTAEGSYESPGGTEAISVTLTIADDVVTDVTVTPEATAGNAARFQSEFASGITDVVVGQSIDGLAVDKVSGSSLTGEGFNAALDLIRADAQL